MLHCCWKRIGGSFHSTFMESWLTYGKGKVAHTSPCMVMSEKERERECTYNNIGIEWADGI